MYRKEAKPLSEAIAKVLKEIGFRKRRAFADLSKVWQETVGQEIGPHTRVAGFSRGILFVEVDSSSRLQELSSFYKDQILQALRQKVQKFYVADLKFTLAQWESQGNEESTQV